MIVQQWSLLLQQSFYSLSLGIANFLPNLLFAIIILLIGWFIGVLLGRVIMQAIAALRVDHALRSAGFESVINRSGYALNSGAFVGALVKWFVILVFLMAGLQILGLSVVVYFLQQIVVGFLPNVIIAVLIILVAAVIAELAQNIVAGAARAGGIAAAGFAGTVARWAIWIFAILAALEQLQVAQSIIQTLFTGVVVALALGFGLSFGLGGQESAARFLDKVREDMKYRR